MQKEILDAYQTLSGAAEKSRVDITQFFNDIRKILAERETSLKQRISEILRKEESNLKFQEDKVTNHLQNIALFSKEFDKISSESDIKILGGSTNRLEIVKKATMALYPLDFSIIFPELNRENELTTIWRSTNPQKHVISNSVNNKLSRGTTPLGTPNVNIAKTNKLANSRDLVRYLLILTFLIES